MYAMKTQVVDEPIEAYHATAAISSSAIRTLLRSPAHYKCHYIDRVEKVESEALRIGGLIHTALLQPELLQQHMVVRPKWDMRTKSGKEASAEWDLKFNRPEAIIVNSSDCDMLVGMMKVAQSNAKLRELLGGGVVERSIYFERDGVKSKTRSDALLDNGIVLELKSTKDASFRSFQRDCWNYRYDVQAAWNLDAVNHTLGGFEKVVILAIEKEPPYATALYDIDATMLAMGREGYKAALDRYRWCVEKNFWPAYGDELQRMYLPPYASN